MKIAIFYKKGFYCERWIEYCKEKQYSFKILNPYSNNIIEEVNDCEIVLWHYSHNDKDCIFAKQLLFSLQQTGKIVYPDFNTGWHFDDKLGEKYLFEALKIKSASSYAFYDKEKAIEWAKYCSYPKVFKLRGGAGSSNVFLAKNSRKAIKYINKAFGKGFKSFNGWTNFIDKIKLYLTGTAPFIVIFKAFTRIFIIPSNYKALPTQKQYAYFQEFIPNDGYDIRVEIIGNKAVACVRFARKNDWRASGGHQNYPNHEFITPEVIKFAFDVSDRIGCQTCAMDIVRCNSTNELFLIETSYCFGMDDDEFDHGYWDREGKLHICKFNALDWIIDNAISEYKKKISLY